MASKGIDTNTSRVALPPPTLARDNLGVYISISCGKVSGQLYILVKCLRNRLENVF